MIACVLCDSMCQDDIPKELRISVDGRGIEPKRAPPPLPRRLSVRERVRERHTIIERQKLLLIHVPYGEVIQVHYTRVPNQEHTMGFIG